MRLCGVDSVCHSFIRLGGAVGGICRLGGGSLCGRRLNFWSSRSWLRNCGSGESGCSTFGDIDYDWLGDYRSRMTTR